MILGCLQQRQQLFGVMRMIALLTTLMIPSVSASTGAGSSIMNVAPIEHWEPSWVASSSMATSVAVKCRFMTKEETFHDCVVLLIRSSDKKNPLHWKPPVTATTSTTTTKGGEKEKANNDDNDNDNDNDDELILRNIMQQIQQSSSSSSNHHNLSPSYSTSSSYCHVLGSGGQSICTMTGLASDIHHLVRVIQKGIEQYQTIYDYTNTAGFDDSATTTTSSSNSKPIFGIVQNLAFTMREAASVQGGRPYGVQALLVGRKDTTTTAVDQSQQQKQQQQQLLVYTVDPSGGWRHWKNGITAIGRNAEEVRKQLYNQIQLLLQSSLENTKTKTKEEEKDEEEQIDSDSTTISKKNQNDHVINNPKKAIDIGMKAIIQTMRELNMNQDLDQYEIWIFGGCSTDAPSSSGGGSSYVTKLSDDVVKACQKNCILQLNKEINNNKNRKRGI